jgi:hypothetical protein
MRHCINFFIEKRTRILMMGYGQLSGCIIHQMITSDWLVGSIAAAMQIKRASTALIFMLVEKF